MMRCISRMVLVIMTLGWTAGTALAATATGRVGGDVDASPTGAVSYTIPIEVATGMNGLKPDIALAYSSQEGRGEAGLGWSLSGLSAITRCPRTRAVDGRIQGVQWSNDDRFCLDGQPLLLVSGQHGRNDSRYRSEVHENETIVVIGLQGGQPLAFELRHPDGLVYRYGSALDAQLRIPGRTTIRSWALKEIEDRFGQRIIFRYTQDAAAGEHHPEEILWTTGPGGTADSAPYRIGFSWEERPQDDRRSGFIAGAPWSDSKRLSTIEYAYNDGNGFALVHRYSLDYPDSAADSGAPGRLARITQCGPRDCLPPTTFQWMDAPSGRVIEQAPTPLLPLDQIGDFNGDGATDIFTQINGNQWAVLPADPKTGGFLPKITIGGNYVESVVTLVIDYDGDGRDDLMIGTTQSPSWVVYQAPDTPGGTFKRQGTGVPWSRHAVTIDIDGDGLDDLVYLHKGQLHYRRNAGGRFEAEQSAGLQIPAGAANRSDEHIHLLAGDFDGDGREDLVLTRSADPAAADRYLWEIFLATDGGFASAADATLTTAAKAGSLLVLDINGDGLSDILLHEAGSWQTISAPAVRQHCWRCRTAPHRSTRPNRKQPLRSTMTVTAARTSSSVVQTTSGRCSCHRAAAST